MSLEGPALAVVKLYYIMLEIVTFLVLNLQVRHRPHTIPLGYNLCIIYLSSSNSHYSLAY